MVHDNDRAEFIGQIIDIFEDFLEEKQIEIQNPDRKQSGDDAAIIYGMDYGALQNSLEEMMMNWGIMREGS